MTSTLSLLTTRPAARLRAPTLLPKARRSPAKRIGQASKERPAPQRKHWNQARRDFLDLPTPSPDYDPTAASFLLHFLCTRRRRAHLRLEPFLPKGDAGAGFLIQPLRREGGTCPCEDPGTWKRSRKRRAEPEREAETRRQSRLGGAVWELTPRLANASRA